MLFKKFGFKLIAFTLIICVGVTLSSCKNADIKGISSMSERSNSEENSNQKNKKSAKKIEFNGEKGLASANFDSENYVVYDENNIRIKYNGYSSNEDTSDVLLMLNIENNSENGIIFETNSLVINGYNMDGNFYQKVFSGQKTTLPMELPYTDLQTNNVEKIDTIAFSLKAVNENSFEELFVTPEYSITIDDRIHFCEDLSSYNELYNSDDVILYYKGFEEEYGFFGGKKINFLIENNSKNNVAITADEIFVNGILMETASLNVDCDSKKKVNKSVDLYESELDLNKIDEINEIEFSLKCHDSDTYDDIWDAGTITITIK